MASKVELEAEVERLRTELADKSASPEQIDQDVTSLKEELDRVVDERDALRTERLQLLDQMQKLTTSGLETNDLLEQLQRDLAVARDFRNASAPAGDGVVLNGQAYKVTWQGTVKELHYEGYLMRRVEEAATALVIEKASS